MFGGYRQMDGYKDRLLLIDIQTDRWIDGQVDGWENGYIDGWIYKLMVG